MPNEPESRPTSIQDQRDASSPKSLGSILSKSLSASGTIGSAQAGPRPTGLQPGATGVVAMPSELQAAIDKLDAVAAGRALQASLKPFLRSWLREKVSGEYDLIGFSVVGIPAADEAQQVLAQLNAMDSAGTHRDVAREIGSCLSVTASRERDSTDVKMMVSAMLDGTDDYPTDCIVTAFRRWPKHNRFWPTLAEIRKYCEDEFRWRRSLRHALEGRQ